LLHDYEVAEYSVVDQSESDLGIKIWSVRQY